MVSKINNNLIKVNELNIPAKGLIPSKAILRDISFSNKVDADGKRTDEVEAVRYDLIDRKCLLPDITAVKHGQEIIC